MIFFKLGSTCGGRFPAPRASITKPLVLLVSLAIKSKSSLSIPAYAFNKYT